MFHINQLTKISLLVIWCTFGLASIFSEDKGLIFKENIIKEFVLFCVELAAVTLSFILSRIIAAVYTKNQLHRYFYT